jgi:subtilisin
MARSGASTKRDPALQRIGFSWGLMVLGLLATIFTASSSASPQKYIVVLKEDSAISLPHDAEALGATPTRVYHAALHGYAAVLDDAAQQQVKSDPNVLMAVPDRRLKGNSAPERHGGTRFHGAALDEESHVEEIPQFVPPEVERVGALQSPTANIDGVDQPFPIAVAVIDSGIRKNNPELNVVGGTNCSESPGGYGDVFGHGTMVSGVLAARDNAFGIVGVAPGAPLYSVKVLSNVDNGAELSNIICGIDWVTAHRDEVHVANMSFGGNEPGLGEDGHCGRLDADPLHLAICQGRARGVTFIAGAGNEEKEASAVVPAAYSQVITVGGLVDTDGKPGGAGEACYEEADDTFASFSNFGKPLDILASASCVVTTWKNGTLTEGFGTSFATPAVSGATALLLAENPALKPGEIEHIIKSTGERAPKLEGEPKPYRRILNVADY